MTVNALPSIFMEVGLAIGMALFVAVSLGTPGDEARVLFGVFAVAGLRLMPSVRNMMSGWSALKYNRYTIDMDYFKTPIASDMVFSWASLP